MPTRKWLSENNYLSPFQIEGDNCVSEGKSCSNKGGLLLYIDNTFTFEIKMNFNIVSTLGRHHCKHFGQWITQPTNNFQHISATTIKSNSGTIY